MANVVTSTVLAGAGSVAFVGLGTLLGGPVATLVLAISVGGSPYFARQWVGRLRDHDQLRSPAPKPPQQDRVERTSAPGFDLTSIQALESAVRPTAEAASLSDETLCLVWRASFSVLQRADSPAQRLRIVEERMAYLDELERRNPHGVAAWFASGARAAGNPSKFIVGDGAVGWSPIDWDGLIQGTDR